MLTLERKAESGAESTLALAESGYIDLPGLSNQAQNHKIIKSVNKVSTPFMTIYQGQTLWFT
jgi:hypothetical protein